MPSGAIEQDIRPDNISMNEVLRGINAPVDVRFRSKIDNCVKMALSHKRVHLVRICNIGFEKFVTLAMFFRHAGQISQIPGVSEDIDVDHRSRLVMLQEISDKVTPNKSTATRNQYEHRSES